MVKPVTELTSFETCSAWMTVFTGSPLVVERRQRARVEVHEVVLECAALDDPRRHQTERFVCRRRRGGGGGRQEEADQRRRQREHKTRSVLLASRTAPSGDSGSIGGQPPVRSDELGVAGEYGTTPGPLRARRSRTPRCGYLGVAE
jgi:hypothetical protein